MPDEVRDKIIDIFWESTSDMSWEDWCSISAGDKESIVVDTISEFVEGVDSDDILELFWDWANGLEESDFED